MIICVDCSNYQTNTDFLKKLPFDECPICHKFGALTDGHRKEAGKFFDCQGNELAVGDTLAYSVAAGRSSGRMVFGKITKLGPRTISVEVETIDWEPGFQSQSRQLVRSWFNYHPSKCLKVNT